MADDLRATLTEAGHHAEHFVSWSATGYEQSRSAYGPRPLRIAAGLAHRSARRIGLGEIIPFELPAFMAIVLAGGFDAVHFHDTSSSFSPLTLRTVSAVCPALWTFHDCSPFTGGCIYPQMSGCTRYVTDGCGQCPQLGEWPLDGFLDTTKAALSSRRGLHSTGRLTSIAPSRWMAETAMNSGAIIKAPLIISNMVDCDLFKPIDARVSLRRKLGLPEHRPVLAVSSGNISDVRKGIPDALAVASKMDSRPFVVLIGKPDPKVSEAAKEVEFISTGYLSSRAELAEWLAASDAFLFTSKADNQPLSVMEALACGTPVYGWPTGGVPEMIRDGIDGRMVEGRDIANLAKALQQDLADGNALRMRHSSRERAVEAFSKERFVAAHLEAYAIAINRRCH